MTATTDHLLYPMKSALGQELTQAETDRNGLMQRRLEAAIAALEKVEPVCAGYPSLSETDERFAREILLDIVASTYPASALALVPFVLFVRSRPASQ